MFSTILKWDYDVDAMRQLVDPITQFKEASEFHLVEDRADMDQHIFLLRDMPQSLQQQIIDATPLPLDIAEHSVAIETVKQGTMVKLHQDWLMGWKNPLTRKTNIMFNLEDVPIEIIHKDSAHNKMLHPGEVCILDVTKIHGASLHSLNKDFYLYTVNLRLSYRDTVELFNTL